MPLLGLGVYLNKDCIPACEAALKHGYRYYRVHELERGSNIRNNHIGTSTALKCMATKKKSELLFAILV